MRVAVWWVLVCGTALACGGRSRYTEGGGEVGASGGASDASGGSGGTGALAGTGAAGGSLPAPPPGGGGPGQGATGTGGGTSIAGAPNGGAGTSAVVVGDRTCVFPATASDLGEWVPVERGPKDAVVAIEQNIAGGWYGIATTPWVPPYDVSISFTPEGTYRATCTFMSSECCTAFYYGSEAVCPERRYAITAVTSNGDVSGTIDIGFGGADGHCELPAWQGELLQVAIDGTFHRLRFDFMRSDGYGPVHYELEREPDGLR